jgi:phosphatidylglycerol:prolipoprotein diacylglycerol transferase
VTAVERALGCQPGAGQEAEVVPTFVVGPWTLHTYWLATVVAVVVSGTYAFRRLLRLDCSSSVLMAGVLLTVAAGYASSYGAAFLADLLRRAGRPPQGISFVPALLGGCAACVAYCRAMRIPLGRACDLVALPLALGLAIGRLGCFAAGCCYGRSTAGPLGFYLPDENGLWAVRYPTQLMAAGANLLIYGLLLAAERRGRLPFPGALGLLFIALYSLKRFGLAFLRASGAVPLLGPFSWMHLAALGGLLAAAGLFAWNLSRREENAP